MHLKLNQLTSEFTHALQKSAPLLLSAFPSGVVFGALAANNGFSVVESLTMSGFVYSGAAQFTGLQLISSQTELVVILLTTLLLSLRFMLYSISLLDQVRSVPIWIRAVLAFGLIDQVFFLAKDRYERVEESIAGHVYFFACVLLFYINWMAGTGLGLLVGDALAAKSQALGLDFVTYAAFAAMLAPYLKQKKYAMTAAVAVVILVLTHALPYNLSLITSCLISVGIVLTLGRLQRQPAKGVAK